MEWWQAIVLGLVEGITEYLPVSSTGHLILASGLMGLGEDAASKNAVDDFNIIIQGGAILAVVGLYWPTCMRMLKGLFGRDPQGFMLLVNLAVAFMPAAVIGLLLRKWIKANLFGGGPVLLALAVGGIYMLLVEQWRRGRFGIVRAPTDDVMRVSPKQALVIGFFQCVAMWPGTSRSMMTITGGLFAGLKPKAAAEFSFLLGLPTLLAATLLSLVSNLKEASEGGAPSIFEQYSAMSIVLGMVTAAISAALAVKWLVGFLNRHGLSLFGWYRLALCVVLGLAWWGGLVRIEPERAPAKSTTGVVEPIQWPDEAPARGGDVR